jgi:hypothetical protein
MIQGAADLLQLRPYWEREYMNGDTQLQFQQWIKDPEVIKRYQAQQQAPSSQIPVNFKPTY